MASSRDWISTIGLALLHQRNATETQSFHSIIKHYNKLIYKQSRYSHAPLSIQTASLNSDQAERYLLTIQSLEHELANKTAQLAQFNSDQLSIVKDNNTYLQEREHLNSQLLLYSKKLEEEKALHLRKDSVINDLKITVHKLRMENEGLNVSTQKLRAELAHFSQSKDSPSIETFCGDSVVEYPLITRSLSIVRGHATEINSICFNQSGNVLFSASSDGTIRAWDTMQKQRPNNTYQERGTSNIVMSSIGEYRVIGTAYPLMSVCISPDGGLVLGSGSDRKCTIWKVGPARVYQSLTGHKGKVMAAAFMNTHVLTGSSDRSIRIWDVARAKCIQAVPCHSACNDLDLLSGGMIASAHQDGMVRFWDARTRVCVKEMSNLHLDQVTSVTSAISANQIVSNSRDHVLKVIDPRTFEILIELQHPEYHCGSDWNKASIRCDSKYVAAGGSMGGVFIWSTLSGEMVSLLRNEQQGSVACCAWQTDGRILASCDKNGLIALWD